MPVVMHKVAYAGSEARRRVKKSVIQVGQKKRYFRVCFAHSSGQSERAYGNMGLFRRQLKTGQLAQQLAPERAERQPRELHQH